MRWSGYAELWFVNNAHMAFAHAVEQTGTDLFAEQPDAWLIEDRRIVWHAEGAFGRAAMESSRRFLEALACEASRGEAFIEAAPLGRWTRHAGPAKDPSDRPDLETPAPPAVRSQREPVSSEGAADGSEDSQDSAEDSRPTIPMTARRRHDEPRVDRWSAPISERRHAHHGRSRSRRP